MSHIAASSVSPPVLALVSGRYLLLLVPISLGLGSLSTLVHTQFLKLLAKINPMGESESNPIGNYIGEESHSLSLTYLYYIISRYLML